VLTAAPQCGFGYFFLPLQIGAREMAFPRLSALSFWLSAVCLVGIIISVLFTPERGATLWLLGLAVFSLAMFLASLNTCVTAIELRTRGMTLPRLPITVWAWLLTAVLSLLIFSILSASAVFLLSDRLAETQFFHQAPVTRTALPILWQRWFWFFAQSEVYVAMLPCFGIVTHLISVFARKPLWSEGSTILALCAVGLFGFCIWGEHMFASGLNPCTPLGFSMLASSLGLPASVLVICWIATLWGARVRLTSAKLFALGFLSLFLSGGISGLFLSRSDHPGSPLNDSFLTGHFHLVMGVAAMFAIFGAFFFWFPTMFGRQLNETLGKLHFWLTLVGVFCLFMTMHWSGLISRADSSAHPGAVSTLQKVVTAATIATVSAQLIFMWNLLWSLLRNSPQLSRNPWRTTTLEWFVPSPPPQGNFGSAVPVVHRGP
jgi:cytochrome c oxidase subunit 1